MDKLEIEFDLVGDEEVIITSVSDIEYIICKISIEQDEIVPSPQDVSDEELINYFFSYI